MSRRLALIPCLRRAVLALALVAFAIPALGGLIGGICLGGDGFSLSMSCCTTGPLVSECGCCDASAATVDGCCGSPVEPGSPGADPVRGEEESCSESGCCAHIPPSDQPSAPIDGRGPRVHEAELLATVAFAPALRGPGAPARDLLVPRAEPPPLRAGHRPFALRI